MTAVTARIPTELYDELMDVARLGYEDKSEVIRIALRRSLPAIKKSFIGCKQTTAKKNSQ